MNNRYVSADLDILISNCVYGYYVKYDRLAMLINSEFYDSKSTELYIYIDMKDLLRHVDKYIFSSGRNITNALVITSGIINMVAHYRYFFASRYNCTSKFWIIDSVDNVIARKMCSEFSISSLSPRMQQIYDLNMEIMGSLCQYIYNVQYEKTEVDFVTKASSINDIENKNGDPAIMITKDPFSFQVCMNPNSYVLRPKKNSSGDVSYLVTNRDAVVRYMQDISRDIQITEPISVSQLSMLMAMSRVPSRHLKNIYNLKTAQTILHNAYINNATRDYIWDLDRFMDIVISSNRGKHLYTFDQIRYRYLACEAIRSQGAAYKTLPESMTYNGIVNLYDPKGIQSINNEYFKSCPLDLNVL